MGYYDWLDLSLPEHRQYLLTEANFNREELKEKEAFELKCHEQETYIKTLEKQVRLLQKTLDAVNKNKVLMRQVRRCGRKR